MFKAMHLLTVIADIFENFRTISLKINESGPACFLTTSGLTWQAALKNTKVKSGFLTDIDILLMVERDIKGRICHSIYRFVKLIKNTLKIMIKIKNCCIFHTEM